MLEINNIYNIDCLKGLKLIDASTATMKIVDYINSHND